MALITEKGRLAVKGDVQSGTSRAGNPWSKQTIVIEILSSIGHSRCVALDTMNVENLRDIEMLRVGDAVECTYSVTSREYKGKWYTNAELYRIRAVDMNQSAPRPRPQTTPLPTVDNAPADDDLPF